MTQPPREPSKLWRLIRKIVSVFQTVSAWIVAIWLGISAVAFIIHILTPAPQPKPTPGGYWYCWDRGAPRPHHVGYRVSGDHVCTEQDIQNARSQP